MDERLRNAERLYDAEPTWDNLFPLVRLRVLRGENCDEIGRDLGSMATQMAPSIKRDMCSHHDLTYVQEERRYWSSELPGYITNKYHWHECFECGHREGFGEGWKKPEQEPTYSKDWNDLPMFKKNPTIYRRNADDELRRLERRYHAGEPPGRYIAALRRLIGGDPLIPQTPTEGLEFHKTLILSTAHLTYEDSQQLDYLASTDDPEFTSPWMVWDHFGYGWWLRVPDSGEEENWQEATELFSSNLLQLMLFALGHDCDWLRLDADGLEVEGLPTFEW
jgi:hypothetical protein